MVPWRAAALASLGLLCAAGTAEAAARGGPHVPKPALFSCLDDSSLPVFPRSALTGPAVALDAGDPATRAFRRALRRGESAGGWSELRREEGRAMFGRPGPRGRRNAPFPVILVEKKGGRWRADPEDFQCEPRRHVAGLETAWVSGVSRPRESGRRLVVGVYHGSCDGQPANRVARVEERWSRRKVKLLILLRRAERSDLPCPADLRSSPVEVRLSRPVGRRVVVDGGDVDERILHDPLVRAPRRPVVRVPGRRPVGPAGEYVCRFRKRCFNPGGALGPRRPPLVVPRTRSLVLHLPAPARLLNVEGDCLRQPHARRLGPGGRRWLLVLPPRRADDYCVKIFFGLRYAGRWRGYALDYAFELRWPGAPREL